MITALIKLDELKNALFKLDEGIGQVNPSQLEKDGILQRFEFTFELVWKVIQEFSQTQGVEVVSPREAIRIGAQLGIIDTPEDWLIDLKNRNLTTHIYDEQTAREIFEQIPKFASRVHTLISAIESKQTI